MLQRVGTGREGRDAGVRYPRDETYRDYTSVYIMTDIVHATMYHDMYHNNEKLLIFI